MEYCDRVIMSEMVKTLIISPDSIKGNTPIDDYKLRAILNQKSIDPENIISLHQFAWIISIVTRTIVEMAIRRRSVFL